MVTPTITPTICGIEYKKQLLDALCSVDPSVEELKRRLDSLQSLEFSWPSDLTAEKNELLSNIAESSAAENEQNWERASHQLQNCLGILITHKSSIPQELKLWLVKRICVPLAFISQFRSRSTDFHVREQDLKTANNAMRFMLHIVRHEYNFIHKRFLLLVEAMAASVPCEYAKLRAQADRSGLRYELDTSSQLYKDSEWLSTEECTQEDLKARCCEVLCIQYYRLGQLGNVWFWLDEWKRSIECIADRGTKRLLQERDCMIVEAMLFAEHGTDKKRAGEWIRDLEKLYRELTKEGNNEDPGNLERLMNIIHVIRDIRLHHLKDEHQALESTLDKAILLSDTQVPLLVLSKKVQRALDSARDEAAIEYMEKMIEHVQSAPSYVDYPSRLALVLSELRFQQATCHRHLFVQKELKFFIDTMEKNRIGSDENSTSFSGASLKLCAHHCWRPNCQHDSHGCPEKDEDEDEDEDENDEELAGLGHHELECPTEFYARRHIESNGNNLIHLKRAIQLLDEALENAKKAGTDVFYVVNVQSSLARTHLITAQVQIDRLLGHESWPLAEQIEPVFLDSNKYHTIGQVQDYLDRNGTSPITGISLSHCHYRQCAQMFTEHLNSLEYYSDKWVDSIEKQKKLYVNLQNLITMAMTFYTKLHNVLSELKNRPAEEVIRCETEFKELLGNRVPEALLWSERGRARFLELQLDQREQQPEILPESMSKGLSAFYSNDQVAWNVIRSSLDACGEGTAFLEYFFEDEGDFSMFDNLMGRVYGVQMASDRILEPLLMANLTGDPVELQSLIEHLNKAMDPESQPGSQSKYDEEEVRRDLEKLYTLLITPEVAFFLRRMKHDHKLVICPSQVFTKVPFAALRNPAEQSLNKGYMFQSHTISITPSLRVLTHNMERYTALQEMKLMEGEGASIAMGDPYYKNEERRLKKSGAEVEAIASLFPNRCELLEYRDATVENLLKSAKLPSERSSSQAFVHIAAHCETDDADKKQGILCLTEQDRTDMPSSSSAPPVNADGILSAENVVKSKIEWRSHMIVLSACGSGKGEIKAEGVLNLARAFMVAGVPCSVVSQWKVEDDSTAQLMTLFYQRMLRGLDVATALRSSMQEMLDSGSSIRHWAPFMVWGLPTVCLPDELLSEDAGIGLLRRGEELIDNGRKLISIFFTEDFSSFFHENHGRTKKNLPYSDAVLPLKKSLKLLKANKNPPSDALIRCLSWLADCEERNYQTAQANENKCYSNAVPLINAKYGTMSRLDKFMADQCRHLTSAVGYLSEALQYARNGGLGMHFQTLNRELEIWKEKWTLASVSGIDIVVEYQLNLSDPSPNKFLHFCVRSQVHLPRHLARKVDLNRLETASRTASMMSAHGNPESGSFLTALEYLHEILIKPILEDPIISATHHQTLVFIPCKLLEGVPFALLRDGAQPDGEGYLIQTHTVSIVPAFWILKYCNIQVVCHQFLPSMPEASDASLVLCNPAISQEEKETGVSGPAFTVASLFPNHCRALHGADSTFESLRIWANLPSSYTEEYCQAFFHMEAEVGEGFAEEIETDAREEWRARFAVVRACPSANGQIQKEAVIRLVEKILDRGIPCVVMSNYPVLDISSDVFFRHLYTNLKSGESVAAAVRHSMLEMKDVEGFELGQWAAFSVMGDPTVRLPEEMLGRPKKTRHYSDFPMLPHHLYGLGSHLSLKIDEEILQNEGLESRPHSQMPDGRGALFQSETTKELDKEV